MKLSQSVEPFLAHCGVERFYSVQSLQKVQDCLKSRILPVLGARELEGLTRLDVLDFRQILKEASLGIARQYSLLMTLKLLLKFCCTVLKIDCLDPLEIKLPRRPPPEVEFLTNEEIEKVLAAINTQELTGLRLRALVEVLLASGMRISEALSLNRDSIDPRKNEARIVGKGNKPRTVFFNDRSLIWIHRYLQRRVDGCPALFATTWNPPRRWPRVDISLVFRHLRQKAGITKHLTPHLLRHTFCTNLLHNGADITFIKSLAGHQTIQTTARSYVGVNNDSLKQVLERCQNYGWKDAA
jgi:integrase/recombinase XerD